MRIIIHRGTKQIGGSCLEVATASTRLILDVGLPLDDLAAPVAIPAAEREDEMISEAFIQSPGVAAVLISHAHADHTGLLHVVPLGVPIFLSKARGRNGDRIGVHLQSITQNESVHPPYPRISGCQQNCQQTRYVQAVGEWCWITLD